MRRFLLPALALLSLACTSALRADPASELHLKPADIERLIIELENDSKPQVRVFFTKAKLSETQGLIESHLNQPISIFMNDQLIVEPTLKEPLKAKIRYLTLTFDDFATASQVARGLVPTR